jgi:hypothetical protein
VPFAFSPSGKKAYALYNPIRSTPTEKDIRKALSYFQVARNFEGLKEAANAAFGVQSLLEVRADQALSSPHEKVLKLVKTLETRSSKTIFQHLRSSYGFPTEIPISSTTTGRLRRFEMSLAIGLRSATIARTRRSGARNN